MKDLFSYMNVKQWYERRKDLELVKTVHRDNLKDLFGI